MSASIDASDLTRLTADLGALSGDIAGHRNVRKAVEQTADQIETAWNGRLYSDGHAKLTGRAIDSTITEGVLGVAADIGARRGSGRQAGIVRLLENGSIHNAPHGGGSASLDEALPDFEGRLAFAAWAAARDHDLA